MIAAQRGFTLLELLIAVAIFALVATIGYGGLNAVLKSRQLTQQHAETLADLQKLLLMMERDIMQIAARPVRNQYGDREAALAIAGPPMVFALTRDGWSNPANLKRSSLRRIAWGIENKHLVRASWNVLDGIDAERALEYTFNTPLHAWRIRAMNQAGEWLEQWPPLDQQGGTDANIYLLPKALEVSIETERYGSIVRRWHLGEMP